MRMKMDCSQKIFHGLLNGFLDARPSYFEKSGLHLGLVEDSKREKLWKSSRMLKRLLISSLDIEQVMKAEKYCEAKQLRLGDIFVG